VRTGVSAVLRLIRPKQWIKNVVLLAGVVFAGLLSDPRYVTHALVAVAIFCILSSGIYVFNDLFDSSNDRLHPEKRSRPIAAGSVSVPAASVLAVVLIFGGLVAAFALGPRFGATAVAFCVLNVLYTLWLKRHVIVDVMAIATSFEIRAIAGVEALRDLDRTVALSPWLLLCTFFLAVFMALGKRRQELLLLERGAGDHRASLSDYSVDFVDTMLPMVTTSAILAFSIYTIWPDTIRKLGTDNLVYTIPLVVYGFFRYLFLIRERGLGGNPSEILFRDPSLLASVLAWMAAVVGILYIG
jgi:4-hydroxybenzoate polyprenyltransferase